MVGVAHSLATSFPFQQLTLQHAVAYIKAEWPYTADVYARIGQIQEREFLSRPMSAILSLKIMFNGVQIMKLVC